MAGNNEVIMRLQEMVGDLALEVGRLKRKVDRLEERTEETYDKAEMLIDDVALLDERTQSLNKPKHTGGFVTNTEIKLPETRSRSADEIVNIISDKLEERLCKEGRKCSD